MEAEDMLDQSLDHDPVNHPSHYTSYDGFEVIDLTEQLNFNRGNAVKYILRAGKKEGVSEREDLEKAAWYLERELQRTITERLVVAAKNQERERDICEVHGPSCVHGNRNYLTEEN